MSGTAPRAKSLRVGSRVHPTWAGGGSQAALEAVRASFASAERQSALVVERDFVIAGRRLRLRAACADLLNRMSRAFGHLEADPSPAPELTIRLWDSSTAGTPPPPVPDVTGEQAPGAFFYYSDERVRVGYQLGTSGDARVLAVYPHAPTPALSVLALDDREAWYWVADARRIPYWEEATPFRFLLDWWLRDQGVQQLHAASVGNPEGGVLVVGRSGSGKSTTALSVLGSALGYAGDDYVAVALEPTPWVHSLYGSGKLMADHVARLPYLLPALANGSELEREKAVVYVHEHWPENVAAGFPLCALLVSRVTRGLRETLVSPASPAVGLAALAPSTVFQMHTRGQDSLGRMRRLAQTVPTYVLQLGSDMGSTPRAIATLLRDIAKDGSA